MTDDRLKVTHVPLQMITSGYGMRISDKEDKLSTLERLTKISMQNIKSLETVFYKKKKSSSPNIQNFKTKPFLKLKRVRPLMNKLGKLKAFLIKKAMIKIGCLNVIFVARNLKVHLIC